ncbi:hypothetical protein FEM48_Zijuj01G0246800 [Ziziphus jujuba var. spinosa]|uniref:DUF4283 domain-containing protein n=1 Tax=Ziziphus jujuba var. spinosa TaxID=714518 RepID=A0A978W4I6_ZIZJJ|nr:hypothetical protein FEM48_Zijuj01G0246800 [Ziziphus jujuba var. spinosa]
MTKKQSIYLGTIRNRCQSFNVKFQIHNVIVKQSQRLWVFGGGESMVGRRKYKRAFDATAKLKWLFPSAWITKTRTPNNDLDAVGASILMQRKANTERNLGKDDFLNLNGSSVDFRAALLKKCTAQSEQIEENLDGKLCYNFLVQKLYSRWRIQGALVVIDLRNGYYLVKLPTWEDHSRVLSEGPWVIAEGRFARICVEVDISKPLIRKLIVGSRIQHVEYEGGADTENGDSTQRDENFAGSEGEYGPWLMVPNRK